MSTKGQLADAVPRTRVPAIVRSHDIFNLVCLAILNVLNLYYIFNNSGFTVFFWTTSAYFVCDSVFVGIAPNSVKSPVTILSHHMITGLYMLIPYYYPKYAWCMSYCMLVEVNTWMLIAKRNMRSKVLEALFYISWVLLRNIWYPYLIYLFYSHWVLETEATGSRINAMSFAPFFQTFLTGLNFHWTKALFLKPRSETKHL